MKEIKLTNNRLECLVDRIVDTYEGNSGINFVDAGNLPVRGRIIDILDNIIELLFPGHAGMRAVTKSNVRFIIGDILHQVHTNLVEQIERALIYDCVIRNCDNCDCHTFAANVTMALLEKLPQIRQMLKLDMAAAFAGDPAAHSFEEIVISYPYMTAITAHRIAHELYRKKIPLIPRIISECAHARTGIDIHPGASIGTSFFIDHGTGVVIGETCVIGNNVKIYQGATLGALSFSKDENGRLIKGLKRHPTIKDDVTIYAEATILGDVTIGKGAVIGGNVWIKESVPAGVTVTCATSELVYKKRRNKKNTDKCQQGDV